MSDIAPVVDIILDGKPYAQRNWRILPRVGDFLLLKNGEVKAKVELVVWSDDTAYRPLGDRQWVQIACKTVESIDIDANVPSAGSVTL